MKNILKTVVTAIVAVVFIASCSSKGGDYVTSECEAREIIQKDLTTKVAEDWSNKIMDSSDVSVVTEDFLYNFKFIVMDFVSDSVEGIPFDAVKELILSKDSAGLDVWDFEVFATSCFEYSGSDSCTVDHINKNTFICRRNGFPDFKFRVRIETDSIGNKKDVVEYLDN